MSFYLSDVFPGPRLDSVSLWSISERVWSIISSECTHYCNLRCLRFRMMYMLPIWYLEKEMQDSERCWEMPKTRVMNSCCLLHFHFRSNNMVWNAAITSMLFRRSHSMTNPQAARDSPQASYNKDKLFTQSPWNNFCFGQEWKKCGKFFILMSFLPKEMVWEVVLAQHCSRRATAIIPVLSLRYSTFPLQIFGVRWKAFWCLGTGYRKIVKLGRGRTDKQHKASDKSPECIPLIPQLI